MKKCLCISFGLGGHSELYDDGSVMRWYLTPESWFPSKGIAYSGAVVVDVRETCSKEDGVHKAFRAPILALHSDESRFGPAFNYACPKDYAEWWKANGARVGSVSKRKVVFP